ncbi:MAG TPA: cyclic nucleotide-binding domain-containing protein [Anaeromyxobacteraceae bacterium]|nr:cyclic nucleotide-binding domain-containing protein [Anaeromyxobacteraceae bacterium]
MPGGPREVWGDLPTSAFIGASVLFRTLDDGTRADLLKLARVQSFAPGERVGGDGEDDLFLVRDGKALVNLQKEAVSATVERGGFFGAMIAEPGCPEEVRAETPLEVIRFPGPMIAALAERFPRVGKLLEALREARVRGGAGP